MLYGCEAWSLTLRKECRVRVFENMILRLIFGSKRDENGEWRTLHNEELHSFYLSLNIIRAIKSRRLEFFVINVGNSAAVLSTTRRIPTPRPLRYLGDEIQRVEKVKYLGVT